MGGGGRFPRSRQDARVFFPPSGVGRAHVPARHVRTETAGGRRARCSNRVSSCRAHEVSGPTHRKPSNVHQRASCVRARTSDGVHASFTDFPFFLSRSPAGVIAIMNSGSSEYLAWSPVVGETTGRLTGFRFNPPVLFWFPAFRHGLPERVAALKLNYLISLFQISSSRLDSDKCMPFSQRKFILH